MTVRSTLTPVLVGVHSPCCMQCACESGTEGCQCFFPASPEVARTLVPFQEPCSGTQKALFCLLILLSLLGNGPNRAGVVSLTLGQYGLKPVHTPLWAACLHGEWTGVGAESHLLGGETARYQSNVYSFYKTLISLFGMFNWTWIWSFLLLSKTILDLWTACWAPGQTF